MVLYKNLQEKGYDVFSPCIPIGADSSRILKWVPYFPGYLFVKIDLAKDRVSTFQWMPYAIGLVYFGEKPGYVPENLIQALRRRTGDGHSTYVNEANGDDFEEDVMKQTDYDAFCSSILNERKLASKRVVTLLRVLEGLNS